MSFDTARIRIVTILFRPQTSCFSVGPALNGGIDNGIAEARKFASVLLTFTVAALVLSAASTTQPNAPWHLDRIDQRNLPLSNSYTWGRDGTGVTVYVIDAPVRISHEEFEGRAIAGPTFIGEPGPGEPGGPPPHAF